MPVFTAIATAIGGALGVAAAGAAAGAIVGGVAAAVTGKNVLKGALLGGLAGGVLGYIGAATGLISHSATSGWSFGADAVKQAAIDDAAAQTTMSELAKESVVGGIKNAIVPGGVTPSTNGMTTSQALGIALAPKALDFAAGAAKGYGEADAEEQKIKADKDAAALLRKNQLEDRAAIQVAPPQADPLPQIQNLSPYVDSAMQRYRNLNRAATSTPQAAATPFIPQQKGLVAA